MFKQILGAVILAGSMSTSYASDRNDIPSCYKYLNLQDSNPTEVNREVFVVVDQTVHLDVNMKKNVHAQLANFGKPSDKITIVTFSAMAQGEYTNIPFRGTFEDLPTQEAQDDMNAMKLKALKSCIGKQKKAISVAQKTLKESFSTEDDTYPKTELVGTVLSIGSDLIAQSDAKRKVVVLVSDMLENSETLSFYSNGKVKVPDGNASYERIASEGFVGDFNGAEMNVIGAGYIHGGKSYSSQKSMIELERFWKNVFDNANVELKQFGKPNLLRSVN